MALVINLACFVLGANVGFLVAGLLRAAKGEEEPPDDERKTC